MDTLDPLTCPVAELRRMAERAHVAHYVTNRHLVIRPYRGTRLDIHAALKARADEVRDHIIATRPDPRDPAAEWDAASVRFSGLPYTVLVDLAINSLMQWLAAADQGEIAYLPPLSWWADDEPEPGRVARP